MPNWKKVIVSGSDASLSTLTITNSGSTDDSLLLTATEDSSTAAPVVTFKRNSGTPADADYLGQLKFKGENDADQEVVYAKITAKIQDASDGSEDGLIEFANKKAGSNVITARLRSDSLQLLNDSNLSVDGQISASSLISNNFSGSFQGDGSSLTGVTAAGTLSSSAQIAADISGSFNASTIRSYTGSFTGSAFIDGTLVVTSSIGGPHHGYLAIQPEQEGFYHTVYGATNAGGYLPRIRYAALAKSSSNYQYDVAEAGQILFTVRRANDLNFIGSEGIHRTIATISTDVISGSDNSPVGQLRIAGGGGSLTVNGNAITASVNVSGSFIGDGSGLTGVTANITEEVTVSQTFTNANTASVSHNFGTKDVIVSVYDNNDDLFVPNRINTPDTNTAVVYMDPATTGRVVVAKGGHLVSGSIYKEVITGVTSSIITHNLQEEFPVVQLYESASREMFIPETIKSVNENSTQIVLESLIDCYVVIKR